MNRRAMFIDRDGTLIKDHGYMHGSSPINVIPNAIKAIQTAWSFGWLPIIITNQSAVGRSIATSGDILEFHDRFLGLLADQDALPYATFACFHAPQDGCPCRKPATALLTTAADLFDINLDDSIMVGDKQSDIDAGHKVGCQTFFVDLLSNARSWQAVIECLQFP